MRNLAVLKKDLATLAGSLEMGDSHATVLEAYDVVDALIDILKDLKLAVASIEEER